jgi:stage II sporulation protein D
VSYLRICKTIPVTFENIFKLYAHTSHILFLVIAIKNGVITLKKIIIYIISFIFICFIIPALLTKRTIPANSEEKENIRQGNEQETNKNQETEIEKTNYNYNQYGTISLLHKKTGEIEQVNLDDYLCNVVSAEMPASYEKEALKAQAIVARTYTIYKILNKKHENADICDDSTCCQAWISKEDRLSKWEESQRESNWNKICECVKETQGKIVTYENKPIDAFFHSNSGGITELPVNVWGGTGYPYLQSVETSGEEAYTQYSSEVTLTKDQLLNKLKEKYEDITIDFSNSDDIKIMEYTEGTRVKTIKFGNHELSGVETRTLLGLKSTNFEVKIDGDNIKFAVKGYGHGVGMSQTGADSMAKQGSNAEDIIKHFYTGVEISEVNNL